MDIQNLKDNYPKLVAHMKEIGYSVDYIKRVENEIIRIISESDYKSWGSYADIYLEYEKDTNAPTRLNNKRAYLSLIKEFDEYGQYPDGRRRLKVVKHDKYSHLLPEFKAVIDCYRDAEILRGKIKEKTIRGNSYSAASFLFTLQQNGTDSLEKITEKDVLSVFLNKDGIRCRSCSYKKSITAVFKAYIPEMPEIAAKILAYIPELRRTRKNIQYLKPEEVTRFKQALMDMSSKLSLRERAIGEIAMRTGLRCCDISGLTINDIDWENERINIRQQKTDAPLELPLAVAVGNAIWDYLVSERPPTDSKYIFVSTRRPFGRLSSSGIDYIARKIMNAANIRQNIDDRAGFHIFRHRIATGLLNNNVAQPVISKTLGHTSPNSLEAYLSADFKHLKECALSIEHFPISEAVFGNA